MKLFTSISLPLFLAISMLWVNRVQAENKILTGSGQIQSVFTLPSSPREGRDPFYPESTHAMEAAATTSHTVEISSLRVPGVSGVRGHLLAIINTHTFAVGEEGDVKTASGMVHLRCLDIQPGFVMVEISGQIHRINVDAQ